MLLVWIEYEFESESESVRTLIIIIGNFHLDLCYCCAARVQTKRERNAPRLASWKPPNQQHNCYLPLSLDRLLLLLFILLFPTLPPNSVQFWWPAYGDSHAHTRIHKSVGFKSQLTLNADEHHEIENEPRANLASRWDVFFEAGSFFIVVVAAAVCLCELTTAKVYCTLLPKNYSPLLLSPAWLLQSERWYRHDRTMNLWRVGFRLAEGLFIDSISQYKRRTSTKRNGRKAR